MTTTADTILLTEKDKQRLEKIIEVSKAALEGQEIECFEYNGANKSWHQANCVCWNWRDYDYRIKPPDPELLECYINVVDVGTDPLDGTKALQAYWTKEEAIEPVYGGPTRTQAGVLMRQVTPQMEQNDLDAARYRWLIANGYNDERVLWDNISEWDELIDKAMEE